MQVLVCALLSSGFLNRAKAMAPARAYPNTSRGEGKRVLAPTLPPTAFPFWPMKPVVGAGREPWPQKAAVGGGTESPRQTVLALPWISPRQQVPCGAIPSTTSLGSSSSTPMLPRAKEAGNVPLS